MNLAMQLSAALLASLTTVPAFANSDLTYTVQLRPGVSVQMHATVVENQGHGHAGPCSFGNNPKVALGIHGLAHNSGDMAPFAQSFLAANPDFDGAVLIDLPGHGQSGLPSGAVFGTLTLEDYVTSIIGSLDQLTGPQNMKVKHVFGHSMGALLTELTQDRLVSQGGGLGPNYGVRHVTLLASSIPGSLPWQLADSGTAAALAGSFITSSNQLGPYISIPAANWLGLFFTNLQGQPVANIPTVDQVNSQGLDSPEALYATLELVGAGGFSRVPVASGIFGSHGTQLTVASFAQDITALPAEEKALYEYLTGDSTDAGYVAITTADSCHDMLVTNPSAIVSSIESTF